MAGLELSLADKVINLCERRGFIVQNSVIYGGMAGFFDFLAYGSQLKRNVEQDWWHRFVELRSDVVGIDGAIITHPKVWEASGHAAAFNDPLVECGKCKEKFRADHLVEQELGVAVDGLSLEKLNGLIAQHKVDCPKCGGGLEVSRPFNLMFATTVGAKASEDAKAFLRPETAQLIFANFKLVQQSSRLQLPFGIAQVGKAFRNEISPRNFVFRCREFSQMELEYFVHPERLQECPDGGAWGEKAVFLTAGHQAEGKPGVEMSFAEALAAGVVGTRVHAYWLAEYYSWLLSLGLRREKLRLRQHVATELSHYSSETWDVDYEYSWGFKELLGVANRSDFDLKQQALHSGQELSVFVEAERRKVVPFVIEPSVGVERLVFTLLLDAFEERQGGEGSSVVLHLTPRIAPVAAGVFPLLKKGGLREKAFELYKSLQAAGLRVEFDEAGSIGKRYARMDEVGAPFCVTVDFDSLEDGCVTVRERGSGRQCRVGGKELPAVLAALLQGAAFETAGKMVDTRAKLVG
ncbi:MAG: glycine--tRNA ligase [Candidatus Micrarchaeota archaeon]